MNIEAIQLTGSTTHSLLHERLWCGSFNFSHLVEAASSKLNSDILKNNNIISRCTEMAAIHDTTGDSDYGAFMERFVLGPISSSSQKLSTLNGLSFAVKDIFDLEGYVTGFGNPDWARSHGAATSTAPAVLALLRAGATCLGKTVMDELAYSINGENKHYGTPTNPYAPDRVPGGSSSGSAVAVGAMLVDFSLGTDTGGSVRVPASYCGIFGFRPSHGIISTTGVIPMAESFDTVGWFSRDPGTLNRVGRTLLQLPEVDPVQPARVIIAEDCFKLLSIPSDRITKVLLASIEKLFGGHILSNSILGDYVEKKVPSLKHFKAEEKENGEYSIASLVALSNAMRLLQRSLWSHNALVYAHHKSLQHFLVKHRCEFKKNHGEWLRMVKPNLGPGISERTWEALSTSDDNVTTCHSLQFQLRAALTELVGDFGILAIPTVPGPPPKLQAEVHSLERFRARAFSLLSIAGVSGFCQVTIPLGKYESIPVSVSLLAKHGSDGFLLNLVEMLYDTLKEQVEIAENLSY